MNISEIVYWVRDLVYMTQAAIGLYSTGLLILMMRRLSRQKFRTQASATAFMDDVRSRLEEKDLEGVAELCDSPPYWSKAVPQLILVALQNRHLSLNKLRRLLGETFEREVVADFDYKTSWIVTTVKSAPMLGLLGTVMALIAAFSKIASIQQTGTDPAVLAGDISHALLTTAFGLVIAIPLTLAGNMIHVRVGKLQVMVQQFLGEFLDAYDAVFHPDGKKGA